LTGSLCRRAWEKSYFKQDQQDNVIRHNIGYEPAPNTAFWTSSDIEMRVNGDKNRSIFNLSADEDQYAVVSKIVENGRKIVR